MADNRIVKVIVGDDNADMDAEADDDTAVIVGNAGTAHVGTQGIACAGAGGEAIVERYGIAIAGPGGAAVVGAGSVACAYDGGSASGGDGSVAWARRGGPAKVDAYGMASALDAGATVGDHSIAVTLRQNATDAFARAGQFGVAVVHNHPELNAASGPAVATADSGGVAIAFDGNHVAGSMGALLVALYRHGVGYRFAVGVVDGETLKPGQVYTVDAGGNFVPV